MTLFIAPPSVMEAFRWNNRKPQVHFSLHITRRRPHQAPTCRREPRFGAVKGNQHEITLFWTKNPPIWVYMLGHPAACPPT